MVRRVVLVAMLLCAGRAYADDFFSSSPGPLSSSHSSLDAKDHCQDCHVGDTKELSNDKCLNCHDHNNLRDRIAAGKGLHASPIVRGKPCQTCHVEHKGTHGDSIMGWKTLPGGHDDFNHQLTGWPLNGKHATTDCAQCHKHKDAHGIVTYMGTDRLCGACHLKEQPHKFEASERDKLACERCHGESVWKPAKTTMQFNHDDKKDALMPLLGSHHDVACEKCHPKSVFNLPVGKDGKREDNCGNAGCHVSPHTGHLFGTRPCEWCHSPTFRTLKEQNFDHTEKTRFDLGPAHDPKRNKAMTCEKCHTKALGEGKPNSACEICHAKDSHHGDRFKEFGSPPKCGICHPSGGPKFVPNTFNHAAHTKFQLTGKHADIPCRGCHRGGSPSDFEEFTGLLDVRVGTVVNGHKVDCRGCHQHKNVHDGKWKSNQCTGVAGGTGCHTDAGRIEVRYGDMKKLYHGPTSNFPLVKGHATVPCGDCHTGRDKAGKTTFTHLEPNCDASGQCHEDSLHKGSLGDTCAACHSPGTWDALKFDHDAPFPKDAKGEVSEWPLKGEHKKNKCEECHPKRDFAGTHANCSAEGCHQDDDAHKGRLGDKCEKCHVETGDNIFNHNTMSKFHLDGKHLQVRCADCHPSITFKPRPTSCFGCHPEPAVHKGQYGTACEQCHTTRTFVDVKPLHDVGDFSLRGMHDNIACERCHKDNRPLAGSGNLCINCHRQDDIHNNSLSPRCGECHTQWSFAPARFDHSRVGCNLTGLHRTIACFDCHRNGNFYALTGQCESCHLADARRFSGNEPGFNHATDVGGCATCHSPNTWITNLTTPTAGPILGRDSVCR
ncbi:MAG TPA: hypothetical protein VMJ10_34160 [Kofleriaceae bacterium]|nr:hypothetical protein [Kofleriaceae bacterium]